MFEILTGTRNILRLSAPIATGVTLSEGKFVTFNASEELILTSTPTALAFALISYGTTAMDVMAAGVATYAFGIYEAVTTEYSEVYGAINAGDPLTTRDGQLVLAASGEPAFAVAKQAVGSYTSKYGETVSALTYITMPVVTGLVVNHVDSIQVAVGTVSASKEVKVYAPADISVVEVQLIVSADVAASDTNYWDVEVNNVTQSESLGSKDTTVASGTGISEDEPWDIGVSTHLTGVLEGDVLSIDFTKAASAPDLEDLTIFVKYQTE